MRPDTTRTISDQVINRRYKDQLVPASDMELDNYLDSIDSELKQPLRIKVDVAGSYNVSVETIDIQNPETLVHRSRFPIKKKIPDFSGASITFPATSGNPIVVVPGQSENLNIPNDQYAKVLIQIDDTGSLLLRQGFPAVTADAALIPKAKSGLTSIGYITLHMGSGGVLDLVQEEDITQFQGQDDTQDFYESMRLREHRPNYKMVEVSSSNFTGADGNIWRRTIEGKVLRDGGALIDFQTGTITEIDGLTPKGANFTPTVIPDTFWQWFSINLVPTTANADNEFESQILVIPAAGPGATMEVAPRADWVDNEKGIRIGQVAIQGGPLGAIEDIFDANIIHQAELSSEGEGRRFGVADVTALKDIPLYERHHHMLRLVESDLQGRGVLYRWDEFDASADTSANPEIGEAPKVMEPDDGVGRWLTITAMDIGASVVRTDMLRDDNVTLAKLAHADPHRVIGYNASGIPTNLFQIKLDDGSVSAPTYSFASDQDTGLFLDGAGSGRLAYTSGGDLKWKHTFDGSDDYFSYQAGAKNVNLASIAQDTYIASVSAYGLGQGTGKIFAGESIDNGGGFGWNGDDNPVQTFGRVDSVAFFRRNIGVETEVFWYRNTNNNVHFNGCIAIKDNDGAEPNPETGYLALCQDNNSLFMKTSTGTIINVPNQDEADARYLNRNASDTPTADNSYDLGSPTFRWANIYAVTFQGNATSANWADLAERYEADEELEPGTVVCLGGSKEITKSTKENDPNVFGVISTQPGFRLNDKEEYKDDKKKPFVAFSGRVPCKVKGKIKKGDRIVTSDIPGVAQALDYMYFHDGMVYMIIGRALEDKDTDGVGEIEVVVGKK